MDLLAMAASSSGGAPTTSQWIFAGVTIVAALIGGLSTIIVKRFREPTRIETLWQRLDLLESRERERETEMGALRVSVERAVRRGDAAVGVVRDLVRQWPQGHIPRLNPVDLDELDEEDAIPEIWKVKP